MSLLIIAIFKNEGMIMEEWIEHYIKEGIDCFLLIDNGSTDNYESKIKKYIDSGYVLLNKNPKKHAQVEIYNTCIDCAKKFNWIMIVDLDEFVYARNGFNTIKDYLNSLDENISQIHIPWKMFGSSGHREQPKSVIQNFTWREIYDKPKKKECKCIMRGNQLEKLQIHYSFLKKNKSAREIFSDNSIVKEKNSPFFENLTEDFLENSFLHLNHYVIQSFEFFSEIKMKRGDANNMNNNNARNKQYFESYNFKDKEDNELKNKRYKTNFSLTNNLLPKENNLTKNIEIVISRYNENLDWTTEYPFNQFQYTVYNKGINENFNKTYVKKIIPLQNVGTCDHTYLYHVVSNYDNDSLKLITVFFPGSLNMVEKLNRGVELLNKVLLKQNAFFIGKYTPNVLNLFHTFTIDKHKLAHSENFNLNNSIELIKSDIRPFGNWYIHNFGKKNVSYYTYNGILSFDKRDIMKYKIHNYERILKQLSVGPKPESAHYMERSWGAIFYPLIYTKVLLTYENSKNNQNLISNSVNSNKINIGGIIPIRQSNPVIKNNHINMRNQRIQNYLRSLWLRRNFLRKRRNPNGFRRNRINRNFFRF